MWQVKGDALCKQMNCVKGVKALEGENLYTYHTLHADLSEAQLKMVREASRWEKTPGAESQEDVKENSQGWCVRVLRRLVEMGVVKKEVVDEIEGRMDPSIK